MKLKKKCLSSCRFKSFQYVINSAKDWQDARQRFVSKDTSIFIQAVLFENICDPNLVQDAFNQNIKSMIVVKGIDAMLDNDVCFKYVIYTISSIALAETN